MKIKTIVPVVGITIVIIFSSSCVKDSFSSQISDTTTIARIFQPNETTSKDAIIEKFTPEVNHGNTSYLASFSWTNGGAFNTSRSLLQFDLTSIPPHTKITNAKLSLFWTSYGNLNGHTGNNAFTIYKISEAWEENSVTWVNQPKTSDVNKVELPKSISANQSYPNINVTNLVQEMIDSPSENHGFMLKLDEEIPYKLVILASSSHPEKSKRPRLIITF